MKYKNLIVLGTSHIAKQSIEEIEDIIEKENPFIIALELDRKRAYALTHKAERKASLKDIRKIGINGFLFNVIGAFVEKKLGRYVGIKPGAEMLKAMDTARKKNIKIALIDQDIEITLKRISRYLTWKDKINFVADILKGIIFRKSELRKLGINELDLTKVPSKQIVRGILKNVKKRYPSFYRVVIEERNKIMANHLKNLMDYYPNSIILAVVGAGHEEEIIGLVKDLKQ